MRRPLVTPVAVLLSARHAQATFPFPPPPSGTPPQNYAAYLRLPVATPPVRPSEFASDGTAWKLTSDHTGEPALDADPQELFGVKGMSVDLAWQTGSCSRRCRSLAGARTAERARRRHGARTTCRETGASSGVKWDDR